MAACGSLRPLFENPLPENPTLMESLSSWNQIKPMKPIETSSITEIFGELHFKEKPESPTNSHPPPMTLSASDRCPRLELSEHESKKSSNGENPSLDSLLGAHKSQFEGSPKSNVGFSPKNFESLQLCTEGLGFESSDEVEDSRSESGDDRRNHGKKVETVKRSPENRYWRSYSDVRSRSSGGFPPPISCIGRTGRPWVCFKSYRQDGRFVLKEIRIPTQEYLRASREDGRLKLHFVHPDEEITEEGEEEEEEEEEKDKNSRCDII